MVIILVYLNQAEILMNHKMDHQIRPTRAGLQRKLSR